MYNMKSWFVQSILYKKNIFINLYDLNEYILNKSLDENVIVLKILKIDRI